MAETHGVDRLELMAYLDGETPPGRMKEIASHLDECAECRRFAEDLGGVSRSLAAWHPEQPAGDGIGEQVRAALDREASPPVKTDAPARRTWFRWTWPATVGAGSLGIVAILMLMLATPRLHERPQMVADERGPSAPADVLRSGAAPKAPMVVRTAQLALVASDFERARTGLEAIVRRHGGYLGNLTANTPTGAGRTLDLSARVPASKLDSVLTELKGLGRVETESQSGMDVTTQYVDLEARLGNARNTERRLTDLLRERPGKLTDVLAVETELSRVRGEVERMEAERKGLSNQVEYATVNVTLREEYRAQLPGGSESVLIRFRNAAVQGYRGVVDVSTGMIVFLLSYGPAMLLVGGLLYIGVRFVYRRSRAR